MVSPNDTPNDTIIQECPDCGALIDVTSQEPFALAHCSTCGGAMRVRSKFDQFELQEALGVGGMGAVFRALDTTLNRHVALKLLQQEHSENPEFIEQFQKEAAITASINHPHVVKVYSTGRDHGRVYIAMELVDRGSLDERMNEGRVDELKILNVGIQIAQGLNAALKRGLIHRDVKPGNILFSSATNAKIVDFGLAVLMEHAGTVAGEVWGTPYYVSPEPLDGRPEDFRSDMYSLGATLFHALTGKPPHEAETNSMRELLEIKSAPALVQKVAPDVSSVTAHVLNKMLNFAPSDRFQSYEELIRNLEYARTEFLAGVARQNQEAEVVRRSPPKRSWGWLTYATAAVIVLGGVGAFKYQQARAQKREAEDSQGGGGAHSALPLDAQYRAACKLLAGGEHVKSAAIFRELDQKTGVAQPLKDWISLHAAVAELFAGEKTKALEYFKEIEARGVYSTDPAEEKLANFFVNTAHTAAGDEPIPAAAVKQSVNASNYEAFALLVYGIKSWSAGRVGLAGEFFRQFVTADPQERHAWVADYKPLVRPYIADLKALRLATDAADQATTMAAKRDALQVVRQNKAGLKFPERMEKRFTNIEEKLQASITAEETQEAQHQADVDTADDKALADAKTKLTALEMQYRFAEALTVASAIQVTGEKGKAERDALQRNADWLVKFKHTLILDITTIGYAQPIQKRNGTQLPAGAHRASEDTIEIVTPFGSLSAPWTDLPRESLIAMAQTFLKTNFPADRLADREWFLGVFDMHAGREREGRDLLMLASQSKDEYRNQLALFVPAAAPAPAPAQ